MDIQQTWLSLLELAKTKDDRLAKGAVDVYGATQHGGQYPQNVDSTAVLELQRVLKGLGLDIEPSGIYDDATAHALSAAMAAWRDVHDEYSFADTWGPLAMQVLGKMLRERVNAEELEASTGDWGMSKEIVSSAPPEVPKKPSAPMGTTSFAEQVIKPAESEDVPSPKEVLEEIIPAEKKEESAVTDTNDRFSVAIKPLLEKEGGFVNDPDDSGGMTMMGITRRWFPDDPIWQVIDPILDKGGDPNDAMDQLRPHVKEFYRREFWDKANCAHLPPGLDVQHFDFVVNAGKAATKALQSIANTFCQDVLGGLIDEDGLRGPTTTKAAKALGNLDEDWYRVLVAAYKCLQGMHYINLCKAKPSQKKFIRGWLLHRLELDKIV